jgi:hypothetical protein
VFISDILCICYDMYYVDVGLMTNQHATAMILFCIKKNGSSQLMVSEQLALRVVRKVKSRVVLEST